MGPRGHCVSVITFYPQLWGGSGWGHPGQEVPGSLLRRAGGRGTRDSKSKEGQFGLKGKEKFL